MFYGRAAELAEINARIAAGARLITVIGPGGIGKTRLAEKIGEGRESVLVDLSTARDEGELVAVVARALNIALSPRGEPFDAIGEVLSTRGLVILDNCEHLVEVLAPAIPRLRAQILATSRERLRVSGEEVFELQPLARDEAIALFMERARRQRGAVDSPIIGDIVESIDCIPLAVELAAARMGVLDAAALLERLSRGIDVLEGRSRDRADRQRTMRATIDWSWSMLEPREQAALTALAVFRGGFDADAAEAVIGPHALDSLEILRDRSLVRTTPAGLGLYEPIRAYALEKLTSDEPRARHAQYFARLAREGRATERDVENLDVVIERGGEEGVAAAIAREPFVLLRGPLRPWLRTLDRLLQSAPTARLFLSRARVRQLLGETDGAIADATAARRGDPSLSARAAWQLGSIAGASGENTRARRFYEEALQELPHERTRFDRETEILTLGNLGTVAREEGELLEARERYEEALSIARREGFPRLRGQYLGDLGALLHMAGDLAQASATFDQAIAVLEEAGDQRLRGLFLGARALVVQEQGDLDAARVLVDRALDVQRAVGDRRYSSYLLGCRAQIDHEAGRESDAERDYRDAIAQCREVKNTRIEGLFIACLGALLATTKRKREAVASFARAEELLRSVDDQIRLAAARVHAGQVLDDAGVRERLEEGREHAAQSDDVRFAIRLLERRVAEAREALLVARDGSSFCAPGGAKVDLSKKIAARRLLAALADAREKTPGLALSTAALFEAGWPGERAKESSAANRVYVALAALRTLGLRGLIESGDAGYRLDPRVALTRP